MRCGYAPGDDDLVLELLTVSWLCISQVIAKGAIQGGDTGPLPTSVQFKMADPGDVQPSVRMLPLNPDTCNVQNTHMGSKEASKLPMLSPVA